MLKGGLPTATTYYKKHKISKGETIAQSLKERFDYGQNPDKTEGGELISSYGCDHMTADAEFLLSKAKYKAATGREQRRDADVLCYQIRQSFKPGEITPEEANRIGYETAMRWTKGKYAFFVATHTDKARYSFFSLPYFLINIFNRDNSKIWSWGKQYNKNDYCIFGTARIIKKNTLVRMFFSRCRRRRLTFNDLIGGTD